MKKLIDSPTPIVFVQYPVGAGGWFLASLLYAAHYSTVTIKHDAVGSGHANTQIQTINNFRMIALEDAYKSILYQTASTMSRSDKIEHIRNTLVNNLYKEEEIIHPISIHCQDINIFLEAFPNSKAIQISIKNEQIPLCAFNFIHKVLKRDLIYFEKICKDYCKDFEVEKTYLQNIDLTALDNLRWLHDLIEVSNIKSKILEEFDSRVLTIDYDQYMIHADADDLISCIEEFFEVKWNTLVKNKLVDELELYRIIQPVYPQI